MSGRIDEPTTLRLNSSMTTARNSQIIRNKLFVPRLHPDRFEAAN
jgi:hypothetical protein